MSSVAEDDLILFSGSFGGPESEMDLMGQNRGLHPSCGEQGELGEIS